MEVNLLTLPSFIIALTLLTLSAGALEPASVASIAPEDLVDFEKQPQAVQRVIRNSLALTKKNLTYQFGSNSPNNRGMDCSGAVQHVLQASGVSGVPRTSFAFYEWARDRGSLTKTPGTYSTEAAVFSKLKPGDLLFWTGTYSTQKRNPPISHVMIYLGRLESDGRGVMFGASDGRRFRGKRITGVSVFDWKVPSSSSKAKFVAYGPVPGFQGLKPSPVTVKKTESDKPLKAMFEKLLNPK